MSIQRNVISPEQKERRRKIKKMTGSESDYAACSACNEYFTNWEIDNDEVIYSVGKTGTVRFHKKCFKELYGGSN